MEREKWHLSISQCHVRKVRTCVLGSPDLESLYKEHKLRGQEDERTNETAAYLITSLTSPTPLILIVY